MWMSRNIYEHLNGLGLEYGGTFANMTKAHTAPNLCIGEISVPDTTAVMPMNFQYPFVVHPKTLDSMLHSIFVALSTDDLLQSLVVPVFVEEIYVSQTISSQPGHEFSVYASTKKKYECFFEASLMAFGENQTKGEPALTITNLNCSVLENNVAEASDDRIRRITYSVKWDPDVDLLSSNDVGNICGGLPLPSEESTASQALQQAAFYLAEKALTTVFPKETSDMHGSHQTFYGNLNVLVQRGRDGHIDFPGSSWINADDTEEARLLSEVKASGPEGDLLCHMGEHLPAILRKELDPLSLIKEGNRLADKSHVDPRLNRNCVFCCFASDSKRLGFSGQWLGSLVSTLTRFGYSTRQSSSVLNLLSPITFGSL